MSLEDQPKGSIIKTNEAIPPDREVPKVKYFKPDLISAAYISELAVKASMGSEGLDSAA